MQLPCNAKNFKYSNKVIKGRHKHKMIAISQNVRGYESEKSTFYPLISFDNKTIVYRGPLAIVDFDIVKNIEGITAISTVVL